MKSFLLLFITLILSFSLKAQNEIEWSKFNKTKYIPEMFRLNKAYYAIKNKNAFSSSNKITIEKFKSLHGKKKKETISLKYKKKKLNYLQTVQFNNKLWLLSVYKNKSQKKTYLFAQELNQKTIKLKGKLKKIGEAKYKGIRENQFKVTYSPDSTKLLIIATQNTKRKDNYIAKYTVFKGDMAELYHNTSTLPFSQKDFEITRTKISNDGRIYALGIVDKSRFMNYDKSAMIIAINDKKDKIYNLSLKGNKYISSLDFNFLENGDLSCIGLYSNKDYDSAYGTVSAIIKVDGRIKSLKTDAFKTEFIEAGRSNFSKKITRNKNKRLVNYRIKEIIPDGQRGSIMIAEQFHITTSISYGNYRNRNITTYYYNYGNLIAVYVDKKGQIKWTNKTQKFYSSRNYNPRSGSFNYYLTDNKVHLIYNADVRNINKSEHEKNIKSSSHRRPGLYIKTIDIRTGKVDRQIVGKSNDFKVDVYPTLCKQINNKLVLLYGIRNGRERFGLLNI